MPALFLTSVPIFRPTSTFSRHSTQCINPLKVGFINSFGQLIRRATCAKANASASCESGGGGGTVDEWIERIPDEKEPLYSHSFPCIKAWLRGFGFFQSKEDRALWHIHNPDWRAQLSLDITNLYIRGVSHVEESRTPLSEEECRATIDELWPNRFLQAIMETL
ncbi:hypothetical protein KI387_001955 [Taxus chinensis]|uniref:Uncharacterized protein n=1 Tax=Taxus chinensis TaxID=29808 RepID=A0AA38GVU5_TAXCH|nr:hypothetical protein KI387_001955 [Taxus chinensis]